MPIKTRQNLCAASRYHLKCPYAMTPTRVIIHNTDNDASAANEVAYMIRNDSNTSFHWAVDDVEAVQGILENRNSWNAGDGNGKGNREGISIEICYSKSGGARFDAAEQNAAELAADILKRYGWGIDRLTKHQDYNGKYCPRRTMDLGWDRFVKMVQAHLIPVATAITGLMIDTSSHNMQPNTVYDVLARCADKPSLRVVGRDIISVSDPVAAYNGTELRGYKIRIKALKPGFAHIDVSAAGQIKSCNFNVK